MTAGGVQGAAHSKSGYMRKFREIWVEISEITKRNLGDSGTKLWSRQLAEHARVARARHRVRGEGSRGVLGSAELSKVGEVRL